MDFSRLEKNIVDVVREDQVKLGYRSETMRLYYPIKSINRLISQELGIDEMKEALEVFCRKVQDRFGEIQVSNQGERFCFAIPPKGVDYVHENTGDAEFIRDFIETIGKHGCTFADILQQFHKYSDRVHAEKVNHGEFDYLVYFEDGVPDSFRYCITDEGCHFIYHRFTVEDYNDFDFE